MNGTPPVSQEPESSSPARPGVLSRIGSAISWRMVIRAVLSFGLVALILLVVLPKALGATIHDVGHAITKVSTPDLLGLTVLWFVGLLIYSFVLTGSLKGLKTGQALTLNLTGSAVANVVPFGGAVGMSLNYYMLRAWNMSLTEFSSYTVVTNVWNVLMKLTMPAVALVFAMESGIVVSSKMATVVIIAVSLLMVVVVAIVTALVSARFARKFARGLAGAIEGIARLFKKHANREAIEAETLRTRDMVVAVVRVQWFRLSTFMTAYGVAQAALLYGCVQAVGLHVSPAAVLAAYAVERFLSMVPITPAGLGFTQAGAAGILAVMGDGRVGSALQIAQYDSRCAAAVFLY
ncbi:MAG TPA: lysylphosphatidylglycerol synthase transmembrane domain-containing protein, partial [Marmoricola sp.]|nr:lysylphosphatidylglycerol synthase transmembrane domain-containing protein [Marmoricola sp.]